MADQSSAFSGGQVLETIASVCFVLLLCSNGRIAIFGYWPYQILSKIKLSNRAAKPDAGLQKPGPSHSLWKVSFK